MQTRALQAVRAGKRRWPAAALLLLALTVTVAGCGGGRLTGQAGRLTGRIADARNEAPLPAMVTVDGVAYETVNGIYATNPLPYGIHQVRVESPGYHAQTATVNLALPAQNQSFFLAVIPDSTIPMVVWSNPSSGATGVYRDTKLILRFSEPMYRASVEAAFSLSPPVSVTFAWSEDQLVATPSSPLAAGTTYTLTLGREATDVSGNQLAAPFELSFTTGSSLTPVNRVAFASNGDDLAGRLKLYLMDPLAPQAATLLSSDDCEDEQPSWSPDGSQLVFVSKKRDGTTTPHLYVTRVDVFRPQPLFPGSAFWDVEPKWSPDGRRIAFVSDRVGLNFNVFVVDVDPLNGQAVPGTVKQVTLNANWDSNPDWSPDTSGANGVPLRNILAFSSDRAGERWIYAVDVEDTGGSIGELAGCTVSVLTPDDTGADNPAWSPDGTKIAYTSARAGRKDIWVMDVTVTTAADGRRTVTASNHRRLTTDAASSRAVDDQPSWSPDGKYLLFVSNRSGTPDIYQLEVDNPGAGPVLLAAGTGTQTNPAWSRR
ncbi:MAG: Ig-like domain-containing protein [Bacillota bacterium]|nr:Ig-like domain-containing protein [Bacillota bacterium]